MITHLNWRYATKQFDATKKISDADLMILKESIRLTPTSYGLQPFKVIVVENPELRSKLRESSWGQTQITDASHLFVFVAQNSMEAEHIDNYIELAAKTRNIDAESLSGYGDFVKGKIAEISQEKQAIWNAKQVYIALGTLLTTAATLQIDATPMEGLDPKAYDELLGLTDYHTVVVAALGFRAETDGLQHAAKVRKTTEQLFEYK